MLIKRIRKTIGYSGPDGKLVDSPKTAAALWLQQIVGPNLPWHEAHDIIAKRDQFRDLFDEVDQFRDPFDDGVEE